MGYPLLFCQVIEKITGLFVVCQRMPVQPLLQLFFSQVLWDRVLLAHDERVDFFIVGFAPYTDEKPAFPEREQADVAGFVNLRPEYTSDIHPKCATYIQP